MRKKPSVKRIKLTTGDREMNSNQLERLKKDERELGHYLARVKKEGKEKLAYRLQKKHEYLSSRIEDLEEEYLRVA